jgi:hypothetical protein
VSFSCIACLTDFCKYSLGNSDLTPALRNWLINLSHVASACSRSCRLVALLGFSPSFLCAFQC